MLFIMRALTSSEEAEVVMTLSAVRIEAACDVVAVLMTGVALAGATVVLASDRRFHLGSFLHVN